MPPKIQLAGNISLSISSISSLSKKLTNIITKQGKMTINKKMLIGIIVIINFIANAEICLNVKDFGAKGDGKTDDTEALQKTFDAASYTNKGVKSVRKVIIPPGKYNITKSIKLLPSHYNLVITGIGGASGGSNSSRANTVFSWKGDKNGIMFDTYGLLGLQLRDLEFNGNKKCKVLLNCNSVDKDNKDHTLLKRFGQRAGALWTIERVVFINAETGVQCGSDSWTCASDMTLINTTFLKCGTGFRTLKDQNLNYNFIRPEVAKCDIGLHFKKGGNVTTSMLTGYACGYAIKIDTGGINAGTFNFIGTRVETRIFKGKRTALLYASGEVNVKFTSLVTTCMGLSKMPKKNIEAGKKTDPFTYLFTIKNGAMVSFDSSLISGPIAKISSNSGVPSWAQFTNCRFRFLGDPRKDITCDKNSGFEVNNCIIFEDSRKTGKYKINKIIFVPIYKIFPKKTMK